MVERMEASLRFYVDGLGFVLKHRWVDEGALRWCWLEQEGVALMLQEWKEDPTHPTRPAGRVGLGVRFNFSCADALAVYRALRARGLPARRPFVGNARWVVSLDLDVDRLPPLRIGTGIRERLEDRLLRRLDVPLVQEHVLLRHVSPRSGRTSIRRRPSHGSPARPRLRRRSRVV